jgi:hypothetical protein
MEANNLCSLAARYRLGDLVIVTFAVGQNATNRQVFPVEELPICFFLTNTKLHSDESQIEIQVQKYQLS